MAREIVGRPILAAAGLSSPASGTSQKPPKRRLRPRLAAPLLCAFLLAMVAWPCEAADSGLEYHVKAAFLLNFTKFIEWPATVFADSQSPLEICIFGNDPFGGALDDIVQGETAYGHRLVVRRISQPPAPRTCQVLFAEAGTRDIRKILSGLPPGILTVGEGDRFMREGGMIAFVIEDRRVRFDIDQTAAEKAGLRLSARLLTVARTVPK